MERNRTSSVESDNQGDPFPELTDEQFELLVLESQEANAVLAEETRMFEKFLARTELPKGKIESKQAVGLSSFSTRDAAHRKRSKSYSTAIEKLHRLTSEQKCDITLKEIEEHRQDICRLEEDTEKTLENFKAIIEEAETRKTEMKKETYEFERDILKNAVNVRTKKVVAEKCIRYFEDKMKARDALIEKLRLKNSTLKVQMKKILLHLKQKEEMGEVLNEVDFNQLKIENQQYLEKIDERNQDLLRLKMMAGNVLQVLNSFKKRLHVLTMESERLKSEIAIREDIQGKIEAETQMAESERAKAEKINKNLRSNLANFRVPEVMEYVTEKAEIYSVQKKIKSWERKVDIAEMALRTHSKTWLKIQTGQRQMEQWRQALDAKAN